MTSEAYRLMEGSLSTTPETAERLMEGSLESEADPRLGSEPVPDEIVVTGGYVVENVNQLTESELEDRGARPATDDETTTVGEVIDDPSNALRDDPFEHVDWDPNFEIPTPEVNIPVWPIAGAIAAIGFVIVLVWSIGQFARGAGRGAVS